MGRPLPGSDRLSRIRSDAELMEPDLQPCILCARQEVLDRLRAQSTLPSKFLHFGGDVLLEDTAGNAFKQILRRHAVVALPDKLLLDDDPGAQREPLSPAARRDYLTNLRHRLGTSNLVCLEVIDESDDDVATSEPGVDSPWLARLRRIDHTLRDGTAADGTRTLVLVLNRPIEKDEKLRREVEEARKLELFQRRYLMTHHLNPYRGEIMMARWVWPTAVGNLLIWIATQRPNSNVNVKHTWLAWQAVEVGPRPPDSLVERLRRDWSMETFLKRGGVPDSLKPRDPAKSIALSEVRGHADGIRWLREPLDRECSAFQRGLASLRATPGDLETVRGGAQGAEESAFVGWNAVSDSFGREVAMARLRNGDGESPRSATGSGSDDEVAPDLAKFHHYMAQVHGDCAMIVGLPDSPPEGSPTEAAASGSPPAKVLSEFADRRVKRADEARQVLMAALERDRANERHMPLARRLLWGLSALACTAALWAATAIVFHRAGAPSWVVFGLMPLGLLTGYLAGALLPWWLERGRMRHADERLRHNIRAQSEQRQQDIIAVKRQVIEPADHGREDRAIRTAWEQVRDHCRRLRRLLEGVIDDACMPSLQPGKSGGDRVPDEYQNLRDEDVEEYAAILAQLREVATRGARTGLDTLRKQVPPSMRGSPGASSLAAGAVPLNQATSIGEGSAGASPVSANPNEPASEQNNWATIWTGICNDLDRWTRGHLPSTALRERLGDEARRIRDDALEELTRLLLETPWLGAHEDTNRPSPIAKSVSCCKEYGLLSCKLEGAPPRKPLDAKLLHKESHERGQKGEPLDTAQRVFDLIKKDLFTSSDAKNCLTATPWVASFGLIFRSYEVMVNEKGHVVAGTSRHSSSQHAGATTDGQPEGATP